MIAFIDKLLKTNSVVTDYTGWDQLPLMIQKGYDLHVVNTDGIAYLTAQPTADQRLPEIYRQHVQMEHLTGMHCVIYFPEARAYLADLLVDYGIPFVIQGKQIYLPFLGMMLKKEREIRPCSQLSFAAQKLLLTAMYEKWQNVSVTECAARLDFSKMTVSRCFDEIEAMEIPYVNQKRNRRILNMPEDPMEAYYELKEYFRTPLIREFGLKEIPDWANTKPLSGMSALCHYTMLEDIGPLTIAVRKREVKDLRLSDSAVKYGENPKCVIQEIGYITAYGDGTVLDPVSVSMLITKQDLEDPRVEKAINEMIKGELK